MLVKRAKKSGGGTNALDAVYDADRRLCNAEEESRALEGNAGATESISAC